MAGSIRIKEKIQELDLLRALAAISVIVIHVTASPLVFAERGSLYHYLITFANQFARFSIPAFIFVTGLVLFYNYNDYRSTNWPKYFRKRVAFVLLPYIFWSTVYFSLRQYFAYQGLTLNEIAGQFVTALFRGDAYYHLYFVVLVFQFYLLFPLILPLWQRLKGYIGWVTLLLFGLYFGYVYLLFYNIKPFDSQVIKFIFQYQGKLFLTWLGFFALGAYCSYRLTEVRSFLSRSVYPLVFGTGALLVAMVYDFYNRTANPKVDIAYAATSLRPLGIIFTVITIFAILAVARRWLLNHQGLATAVAAISNHSYGIYLVHPLVLTFLEIVEVRLGLGYPWWLITLNLIICCVASYLTTTILSSNNWTKMIIGR